MGYLIFEEVWHVWENGDRVELLSWNRFLRAEFVEQQYF